MKKILPLLLLCSGLSAYSQDTKLANALLWRITGNNLTKPSYLYGTIHLTDKRIFVLGDSVYKALEQTEGFAAELDMNRLGTQMVNFVLKEREEKMAEEPVKIKDAVSAETWNLYKLQLEKKFNKKAEKITVDDLDNIGSKLQMDLFKKGDMPTFLDAWLFGIARNKSKWVGGIEDIEDQLEHKEITGDIEHKIQMALFDDEYYRGGLDWFVKVYNAQQLDSIDALMYREANGKKDYIMIKRNLKMARRMDSLSAIRSTLFAVGAAHLPGDSGVVSLLRSMGFTVSPVISSKKLNPEKYVSKTAALPWTPVYIKDSSYAIQMPGIADGIDLFESMGMDMKMFFDISFMKMYMTFNIELPEERKKLGADSLFNAMRDRYATKGKISKEKQINVNGIPGREYWMRTEEGEMKMQIFIPDLERVVLNGVFGLKEKSLTEAETEKFFQSFVFNKNSRKPAATEKVWSRLNFPLQSFSIEMPLKPKETKDVVSEEGKIIYNWQAIDIKNPVFYGMRVSAMKESMYFAGTDTSYFLDLKERLKEGLDSPELIDSSFLTVNNFPAFKFTVRGDKDGETIEIKVLLVLRGGLSYYIFSVYQSADENIATAKRFLNSFKLLPYNQPEWKPVVSPDKSFTATAPVALKRKEIEEDDIHQAAERYIMYDSSTAVTVYVDKTLLPEWYWHNTDTGFLRKRTLQYLSTNDSIADYKVINKGELKIAGFTVISPGDHLVKRVQMILNGNELYEIFGDLAQQDLPGLYNRFFDDFKILNEKKGINRSVSKADELIKILKNADKKTADEVKLWWDNLEFTKADIPVLQKMSLKLYPDFDTSYHYNNLNSRIFDVIEYLDSNHTTVDFIKNNYASVQPGDEYIKPFVVSYLSAVETAASYKVLKQCLTDYSFNIDNDIYFRHSLYDSLKLTAALFPEAMKLAGTNGVWRLIPGITVSMLDSNLVEKTAVKQYGKYFIASAKRVLEKRKLEIEETPYSYDDLIRILGVINSPESNTLLVKFSKLDHRHIRFSTLITMLENNRPVDGKTIYTLATTDDYRHDLYDELKRINKLKLFPSEYLTQKRMAQSKLYGYALDEEAPSSIEFVAEKKVIYKGKPQKFLVFKLSFPEEYGTYYFGAAGPYSLNAIDVNTTHEATGVYWSKEFDAKKIDALLKEYLASLEEEPEENEKPPIQETIK